MADTHTGFERMRFVLIMLLATTSTRQETDVAMGAKIFHSHCAECHGLKGEGGRGPNLTTGQFYHGSTDADLMRNISDGIPGTAMPGVFFSPIQVSQLVAYIRSVSQHGSSERPEGNTAKGAELFRDKGCVGCHLVRGEGGVRGPDLSLIGSQRSVEDLRQSILDPNARVLRDFWVANITLENGESYSGFLKNADTHYVQILDFKRGLLSLPKQDFKKFEIDKSSIMPFYKDRLSEAEVNDLLSYLWSMQRQGAAK
jgi:putative heme-binding domain-containing protein